MPYYHIRENFKHMFRSEETERENLYEILTNIAVSVDFIRRHAKHFEEAMDKEKLKKRKNVQDRINAIEARGGKTNYQDMYEMHGRVWDLWRMIAETQRLPEDFIEEHIDKFRNEWRNICEKQTLSEAFMRRHADKMNWWAVAHFQDYSEEFLLDYFEEIADAAKFDIEHNTDKSGGFLKIRKVTDPRLMLLLKMRGFIK